MVLRTFAKNLLLIKKTVGGGIILGGRSFLLGGRAYVDTLRCINKVCTHIGLSTSAYFSMTPPFVPPRPLEELGLKAAPGAGAHLRVRSEEKQNSLPTKPKDIDFVGPYSILTYNKRVVGSGGTCWNRSHIKSVVHGRYACLSNPVIGWNW